MLIDIKMTDGYKKNVLVFNSLELACNKVKNIIISEIVFESYKPTRDELNAIVSKKINSLYEDNMDEIIKNALSSFKEMYYDNEDEKVKELLKQKKELDRYVEFQGKVEDAATRHGEIIKEEFEKIKNAVIFTITNDCYSLIYEQVPSKVIEKAVDKK